MVSPPPQPHLMNETRATTHWACQNCKLKRFRLSFECARHIYIVSSPENATGMRNECQDRLPFACATRCAHRIFLFAIPFRWWIDFKSKSPNAATNSGLRSMQIPRRWYFKWMSMQSELNSNAWRHQQLESCSGFHCFLLYLFVISSVAFFCSPSTMPCAYLLAMPLKISIAKGSFEMWKIASAFFSAYARWPARASDAFATYSRQQLPVSILGHINKEHLFSRTSESICHFFLIPINAASEQERSWQSNVLPFIRILIEKSLLLSLSDLRHTLR